jgi:hypothetical protein
MPLTCEYCGKRPVSRDITVRCWVTFAELKKMLVPADIEEFDYNKNLTDDERETVRFTLDTGRGTPLTDKELSENRALAVWNIHFCDKCFGPKLEEIIKVLA